jgi:hypothetical protein
VNLPLKLPRGTTVKSAVVAALAFFVLKSVEWGWNRLLDFASVALVNGIDLSTVPWNIWAGFACLGVALWAWLWPEKKPVDPEMGRFRDRPSYRAEQQAYREEAARQRAIDDAERRRARKRGDG